MVMTMVVLCGAALVLVGFVIGAIVDSAIGPLVDEQALQQMASEGGFADQLIAIFARMPFTVFGAACGGFAGLPAACKLRDLLRGC